MNFRQTQPAFPDSLLSAPAQDWSWKDRKKGLVLMRRTFGSAVIAGIAITWVVVSITTAEPKREGFFFDEKVSPPGVFEYAVSFFCWACLFAVPAALVGKLFFPPRNPVASRTLVPQSRQYPQRQ